MADRTRLPRASQLPLLLLLLLLHAPAVLANEEKHDHDALCDEFVIADWEKHGGFLLYVAVAGLVFYFMETLCDEYFVPALTILCKKLNLSDDIAGATFMAAGASSPELFVALIAVLKKSPVGTGTVVGSELFNMNIIIGFSALCSSVAMQLDYRFLMREMVFYGIALLLLIVVLADEKVYWYEALMMVGAYGLYVLVCGTYGRLISFCAQRQQESDQYNGRLSTSVVYSRPPGAGDTDDNSDTDDDTDYQYQKGSNYTTVMTMLSARRDVLESAMDDRFTMEEADDVRLSSDYQPPSDLQMDTHSTNQLPEFHKLQGKLFKKSSFYRRINAKRQVWQLRHFWFTNCAPEDSGSPSLCYCRNPADREEGKTTIGLKRVKEVLVVQTDPQLFKIRCISHTYVFQAKDETERNRWVFTIVELLKRVAERRQAAVAQSVDGREKKEGGHDEEHDHTEVGFRMHDFPRHASIPKKIFWVICAPVFFGFLFTIPDVRKGGYWSRLYVLNLMMVVVWLAVLSLAMVSCVDRLGCCLGVSSDIMGLTVGSIGTSLPNLFASMLVARQGLANMAVSNAFGSNVFNILIALGLPWSIQTLFIDNKNPYIVKSPTIASTVFVLAAFLLVFVVAVIVTKFSVGKRFGYVLITTYLLFIIYMILAKYEKYTHVPAMPHIDIGR